MSEEMKKLLEQQLWGIANDLRGKMNADEFRDYILGFIDCDNTGTWGVRSDGGILWGKTKGIKRTPYYQAYNEEDIPVFNNLLVVKRGKSLYFQNSLRQIVFTINE